MRDEAPAREYDPILDSITEGVFTVDQEWRITSFNRAAEEITGIPRERAIGKPCKDILRANICEGHCALGHTMATRDPIVNRSVTIGGVETFRDLTKIAELVNAIRPDRIQLNTAVRPPPPRISYRRR